MKTIKQSEIPSLVAEISKRGARPFSVRLVTSKKLLAKDRETKEPCPYGKEVAKVSNYLCFLNFDYSRSVNRAREREGKEGDFQAKKNWFEHGDCRAIVRHPETGRLYIQLKVERVLSSVYVSPLGETLDKDLLRGYLPKVYSPANQGLDKPILTICPALDSIRGFVVDGLEYSVADTITIPAPEKVSQKA